MDSQTDNWTYAEFHAFIMLYAANTDGHITLEEENLIMPTLAQDEYARIKTIFMGCDDSVALNLILSYKDKYCGTQAEKDKILADMLAIYQDDEAYDQIERGVYHLFERML